MLHKADENRVIFALRGKSDRRNALEKALHRARANFQKQWYIQAESQTTIHSAYPHEFAGLQVIDYYLWDLQRMYERSEDRFFLLLAPNFRLIMDLDDK